MTGRRPGRWPAGGARSTHMVAFTGSVPTGRAVARSLRRDLQAAPDRDFRERPVPGHAVGAAGRCRPRRGVRGVPQLRPGVHLRGAFLRPHRHLRRVRATCWWRRRRSSGSATVWRRSTWGRWSTSASTAGSPRSSTARSSRAPPSPAAGADPKGWRRLVLRAHGPRSTSPRTWTSFTARASDPSHRWSRVTSFEEAMHAGQRLRLRTRSQHLQPRPARGLPGHHRVRVRHGLGQRPAA